MSQKRAIVTGGAAGIGAAITKRFLSLGLEVHILEIAEDKMQVFCAETGAMGHKVDVSNFEQVDATITTILEGHGQVDVLVNNAGITRDGFVHKMPAENWNAVIQVNLTSAFNTVRCLSPSMRANGWGRIINISSMNGERGQFGQANYAAAKAGMIGFTKAIAQELAGKGVTANCIAPGFILTDMTRAMKPEILEAERAKIPAGTLGEVEDIAGAAAYLASDDARFVTGHVLSVNGGQYM
ncbi:MAG: 3-oxoacyl-ACP reductase [Rhodospirillaceae bacterium]